MSRHSLSQETAHLPPPVLVTSPPQLRDLLKALYNEPYVAVDTESNSLYAYQEQVCLIQISIPNADYILDPLAELDISSLGRLFADSKVQKIFHAAEYDVMCLKRDFGFCFANLFDTMWAARILGWPHIGLAAVLKETFDVRTNKRYQRYNWGKRPLGEEALAYAGLDTHYLVPLRHLQAQALMQKDRWEESQEVFAQVAATESANNAFDPQDFWRVKGAFDLTAREQTILRELYIWRDGEARNRDRPYFKVIHDRVMIALAQAHPETREMLLALDGIKTHHVRRYGRGILQAIKRGMHAQPPQPPPPPPRHSEAEVERFQALRAWRKRVAARRGVAPDVIVSNATLWDLAERSPRTLGGLKGIAGLGPWKRETYGEAILGILADW
jgi:ribonuclease D